MSLSKFASGIIKHNCRFRDYHCRFKYKYKKNVEKEKNDGSSTIIYIYIYIYIYTHTHIYSRNLGSILNMWKREKEEKTEKGWREY